MIKSITQSPKRVFVVGCPRSGTTLLQSILLTSPSIISFPESHFFVNLFKRRTDFQKRFNLASQYSRPGFANFMGESGYQIVKSALPRYALTIQQQTQVFARTLDRIAKQERKSIWMEKTPDHVNFIDFIETHVRDALFIHIVRNGPDVVASLYDVTHKYPLEWEEPWEIERCLRKWITCVQNTYKHLHKPNHLLIKYETLVNDLDSASQKLTDFINVDLHTHLLTDRKDAFKDIALAREPWKANSVKPVYQKGKDKFSVLFDDDQKTYILDAIAKAKLTTIKD
ncbi:sulfotransferase family protein [Leptothoe spongobia]|uniref:Sulfotransferase n=1 Tax=Leptothoe spongobia TAU-MAC 1115 TaxID=1967444 RepID=A0A947DD38_9CYAN|nr:sulfotransferase [Leptothoe spongobia]MBT9314747.1 sulfotransferase [Leptothoe spongobia TAU-MAC 1115]